MNDNAELMTIKMIRQRYNEITDKIEEEKEKLEKKAEQIAYHYSTDSTNKSILMCLKNDMFNYELEKERLEAQKQILEEIFPPLKDNPKP
jgi:vacuolar-type H+-ATPase subunit E/Vma4